MDMRGEQYIDPHWLFDDTNDADDDADNARMMGADEELELVDESERETADEPEEWEAQLAEDAVLVEDDTECEQVATDEFLLDGFAEHTEPLSAPAVQMNGPLTRRLSQVNASRPLRSAPITLRLDDHTTLTLETMVANGGEQTASAGGGSRRSGCSPVGVLLVVLCLSSVATLMWSGILPSFPNLLMALYGGSQVHHSSTLSATGASSTATAIPIVGGAATPGATAGTDGDPSSTPTVGSTATTSPYAQSATVTFAVVTQSLSSPSTLNACPSNCDVAATVDTPSRSFLHSQHTSGGSPYWAVDILFTTGSSGHVGSVSPVGSVNGQTVTCQNAPFNVNIGGGQSAWFQCVPTLAPVPANAFSCSNCFGFNYTDPNGSYQDTSAEYVTQQDCVSAENTAQGQATSWEKSYTPNVGPQLVTESVWTDTISCSPAVNQHGTTVTGSAWGHVRAEGFNASDAQTAALTQLDAQLPKGYVWKSSGTATSSASCTPTWTAPASGSTTFTVTCVDSDVAAQVWTATSEQQLAASLVGMPLSQAIQTCNAATHSVCHIALSGGNGQTMPLGASSMTFKVT